MDQNLVNLLRSKYTQRYFILSVVVSLAFLFGMLLLVKSSLDEKSIWRAVVENTILAMVGAIIALVMVNVFVLIFVPRENVRHELSVIPSFAIGEEIRTAARGSDEYGFFVRTGRFGRVVTLPILSDRAKSLRKTIHVTALFPNPDNAELMRQYAEYRTSLAAFEREGAWDGARVRNEILASIAWIACEDRRNAFFNPNIYTLDIWLTSRIEVFSSACLVTMEDPRLPGIKCNSGGTFYTAFREELQMLRRQGRKLKALDKDFQSNARDVASVKAAFAQMELCPGLSDVETGAIVELMGSKEQPYG